MKKILSIAALSLLSLSSLLTVPVQAVTVDGNFTVDVTLTSKCEVTSTTPSLNFIYDSFSAAAVAAAPIALTFKCTRGIAAPTVAFDTGADRTSSAAGSTATGEGLVSGLRYTLAVAANSSIVEGDAATSSSIGTAKLLSYAVSGSMEAGQAGLTGGTTTQARSLIVSY